MRWKKLPSLQFVITDRMNLILPLNSNDLSIPLNTQKRAEVNTSQLLMIFSCTRVSGSADWWTNMSMSNQHHNASKYLQMLNRQISMTLWHISIFLNFFSWSRFGELPICRIFSRLRHRFGLAFITSKSKERSSKDNRQYLSNEIKFSQASVYPALSDFISDL